MITQHHITLPAYPRGFHIITKEVLNALELPDKGLINVFIQHTSAALALNENAAPDVRVDMENSFNRLVKENEPFYTHNDEGSDDMPAHIKAVLTGASITIPVVKGKPALGTWQGIFLCEFRNNGGRRKLIVTVYS